MEALAKQIDPEFQLAIDASQFGYFQAGFAYMIKRGDDIFFKGYQGSDICGIVLNVDHDIAAEFSMTKFILQFPEQRLQIAFARSSSSVIYFKPSEK